MKLVVRLASQLLSCSPERARAASRPRAVVCLKGYSSSSYDPFHPPPVPDRWRLWTGGGPGPDDEPSLGQVGAQAQVTTQTGGVEPQVLTEVTGVTGGAW